MKNRKLALLFKLAPLLLPFLLIFSAGVLFALFQSFGFFMPLPTNGGAFAGYAGLFKDSWFLRSFSYSLYTAFVSAVLSILLGVGFSYFIWKLPYRLKKVSGIYKIPLILPHISVAFIVLILFSKSGFISSLLYQGGIVKQQSDFPSILFGGNGLGIILAYVYKETPFVMLMCLGVLYKINPRLTLTAKMLGASKGRIFFKIILPFLYPVINTLFLILFLYSFGAFDIPFLLSESNPEMLSITVYNLYFKRDLANRPYAMAILVFMFIFAALFIFLYSRLVAKMEKEPR